MGLFGAIAKAGVAKKLYDEARKPENQRKLKELVAKARDRSGRGNTSGTAPR